MTEDFKKGWMAACDAAKEIAKHGCICGSIEHKGGHLPSCPEAIRAAIDELREHPVEPMKEP